MIGRFQLMMTRSALAVSIVIAAQTAVLADTLWYNGDPNGTMFLANGTQLPFGNVFIYDDFVVPVASGGWTITQIFGTDIGAVPPNAVWSIRSGMSIGNPGVIIASGTNPATSELTGNV